jgi:hypothetical protein
MANKKITDLTELLVVDDLDVIEIVDKSDTTDGLQGTSKRIKKSNFAPKTITVYANYAALAADQANQNTYSLYRVTDGTAFGTAGGTARTVRYLGSTLGTTSDYQKQYDAEVDAALLTGVDVAFLLDTDNHTAPTVEETTLIDANKFVVWVSGVAKYFTGTNLKVYLKTYFDTLYQAILTAANFGDFIVALSSKTTPVDADSIVISDSAATDDAKKVSLTNFKAYLKTYNDTLYLTSSSDIVEEKVIGTAVYNASMTGSINIDLNSFSDYWGVMTGNTTITFTNTPASGKSVSKTMWISPSTYTLTFADKTHDVGTLTASVVNSITVLVTNFPTVGLKVRVTYELAN